MNIARMKRRGKAADYPYTFAVPKEMFVCIEAEDDKPEGLEHAAFTDVADAQNRAGDHVAEERQFKIAKYVLVEEVPYNGAYGWPGEEDD